MAQPKYSIVSGPSKFDLMLALFDNTSTNQRLVTFHLAVARRFPVVETYEMKVLVNSVEREDGSGESWNFAGIFTNAIPEAMTVRGHFSTKTRRGSVESEE